MPNNRVKKAKEKINKGEYVNVFEKNPVKRLSTLNII